ncbi:metallophosphoesterase [Listeria monocytogenes]|nr:metallophosphoesterase [Listeria monocytogenes]EJM3218171.1 metallophosphoesterase [Listeria monocytogenes]
MSLKMKWIIAISIIIVLLVVGWFLGTRLTVKKYEVSSTKIEKEIKLVQLSDLHFSEFGDKNEKLLHKVENLNPDVIAITGDLFDRQGDSVPKELIKKLTKIAPDYFKLYVENDFDLTLSGHTHGGIVRIPYTNIGAIAPGPQRTILPEYVYGEHSKNGKTMIISAGLGAGSLHQKAFPRLGNPYEIVAVTIKPESK